MKRHAFVGLLGVSLGMAGCAQSRTSMSYKPVSLQPLDPIQKTINQNPYRNVDGARSKLVAQGLRPRVDVDMVRGITHIPKADDTLPKFPKETAEAGAAGAIAATGSAAAAELVKTAAEQPRTGPEATATPVSNSTADSTQPTSAAVAAEEAPVSSITASQEQPVSAATPVVANPPEQNPVPSVTAATEPTTAPSSAEGPALLDPADQTDPVASMNPSSFLGERTAEAAPATMQATKTTSVELPQPNPTESASSGIDPLPSGLLEPATNATVGKTVPDPSGPGVEPPRQNQPPIEAAPSSNTTAAASAPEATPGAGNPLNPFPDDMFEPKSKAEPKPVETGTANAGDPFTLPELPPEGPAQSHRETNVDQSVAPTQAAPPAADASDANFPELPTLGSGSQAKPLSGQTELPTLPESSATGAIPAATTAVLPQPGAPTAKSEDEDLPPLPAIELPPLPEGYQTKSEQPALSPASSALQDAELPTLPPQSLEPTPDGTEVPTAAPASDAVAPPETLAPEASRTPRANPNGTLASKGSDAFEQKSDPAVRRASYRLETEPNVAETPEALDLDGEGDATLVRVGEEVITRKDLQDAFHDYAAVLVRDKKASPAEIEHNKSVMLKGVLKMLVRQTLLLQEAQRLVKNQHFIDLINEEADKIWRAEEMAEMIKKEGVANELELKRKLAEHGVSLDDMRMKFRKAYLVQEMLHTSIRRNAKPTLGDALAYYNQHIKDFVRAEEFTWSEIVVDVSRFPDRASAKKQADALLARLKKGEDFATLAKRESNGATAADGGLWKNTSPDGYAIKVVNQALYKLPPGQLSEVLESEATFHIVRVESHRKAGAVPFAEVQSKVEHAVGTEKAEAEFERLFTEARKHTTIIPDVFADDPMVKR